MEIEPDSNNHLMDRSFLTANIDAIVQQLSLDEKIELLAGDGWWHTVPFARFNVPSVKVTDGPAGARGGSAYNMTPATSFPNATCLAASFDIDLAHQMGTVLAKETKARGASCLLGPSINIQRSPLGGRAFESFAEDPTLSGTVAGAYCQSLQANGVSATIKHYVCNDHEHNRMGVDCIVNDRPLREIYLRPFQIAHKMAAPWAYMTGYNKVNGVHASESPILLEDILRKEWGHEGIVMSDWTGTYSIAEAINAGLDIEFPGPAVWRQPALIKHLVTAHKVSEDQIDTIVRRILCWVQKLSIANEELVYAEKKQEVTRWAEKESDAALVRRIASEGITLLKNEADILPLRQGKIAVIGPNVKAKVLTGGGSARLNAAWSSSPWQGLEKGKPEGITLDYSMGTSTSKYATRLDENFTTSTGAIGFDAYHFAIDDDGNQAAKHVAHDELTRSEMRFNNFKRAGLGKDWFTEVRATFTAPQDGEYDFAATATGKWKMWIDDRLVTDMWDYKKKGSAFYGNGTEEIKARVPVKQGQKYAFRLLHDTRPPNVKAGTSTLRYDGIRIGADPAYEEESAMAEAESAARSADIAVVICGLNDDWESEGDDRPNLSLPLRSNELIGRVAAANPNTVVVLQGGSALAMPWLGKVKAVVQAWYGGCETGTSIADVLYGHVNPSGRLPITFPANESDVPSYLDYKSADGKTYYGEGIWIGYKHYNARNIAPMFAFGHGLSYTTFEYSDLAISSVSPVSAKEEEWRLTVKATVTNTGRVAGSHSVHFYLCPPPETAMGLKHPERTLQPWAKVHDLQPGEQRTVEVSMDKYAISHWEESRDRWTTEPGQWAVTVGYDACRTYGREMFDVSRFFWNGI